MTKVNRSTPTEYKKAIAALNLFCSIRKAEGASCITLENYDSIITPLIKKFPLFLKEPRQAIVEYVSEPENQWTRFTRIKVLKVFCKFLVEEGLLVKNPMRGIKNPMPRKKADLPSIVELKTFINSLSDKKFTDRRLRVVLLVALDTGLRRGELCGLQRDDFDMEGMTLTVRPETSKVRMGRVVPLSPQTCREIRKFVSTFPSDWSTPYLFPTEQGEPLTPSNLGRQVGRKNKELGTHIKIHGLRHLCATEFLRNTGNIALTAKLLGHTNIKTTSTFYEHLSFDDLKNAHSQANVVKSVLKPSKARNKRG